MIKTQIQLEDWQYSSLKRAGADAGRSLSDVVRESVSLFLKTQKKRASPVHLTLKYSSRSIEGNWGSGNIFFHFLKRLQPQIFTYFGKTQICQIRKILILSVHYIFRIERFAETRASGAPLSPSAHRKYNLEERRIRGRCQRGCWRSDLISELIRPQQSNPHDHLAPLFHFANVVLGSDEWRPLDIVSF